MDGWPQFSDAVVDYYYNKKLAYGYIKRSQAPFALIAGELSSWHLPIYACNDSLTQKQGNYEIVDGQTHAILLSGIFQAEPNSSTLIARCPLYYSEHTYLLLRWEIGGETGFNHYVCGSPPFDFNSYKAFLNEYGL